MIVTVYTSGPSCHLCTMTKRHLDRRGIEYTEIALDSEEGIREACLEMDLRTAPVVCVSVDGVEQWWDGFRPTRIDALLRIVA